MDNEEQDLSAGQEFAAGQVDCERESERSPGDQSRLVGLGFI
jgi:hypothetical protein